MTKLLRAGLVALLGFAVATPAALASKQVATPEKGQMTVKDDAKVFHPDSVIKAESKFHGITFKSPTHLTVQTFDKVPADKKVDFEKVKNDREAKHAFMREWVRELAPVESERGVFVLVCQEARALEVVSDKQTDLKRHFGDEDAGRVAKILTDGMARANEGTKTEDEKRTIRGEALVKATDYVIGQLKNTSAPEPTGGTHSTGGHDTPTHKSGGMPWWGWVLIVAGILLFIWIIVAIIRAATGNVYGGMYGGYGGGYGYGGGGPGFFGMFMGGMLGSMAGMWLYNSMMGTHYAHDPSAAAGGDYSGGDTGATDTGAGDYDNGAEAGGDWGGDDAGAADAGGGGGDWGDSGGDAGGGGDWGGDGGGGDWGGGGDFGGGGGDFGGGGGDW